MQYASRSSRSRCVVVKGEWRGSVVVDFRRTALAKEWNFPLTVKRYAVWYYYFDFGVVLFIVYHYYDWVFTRPTHKHHTHLAAFVQFNNVPDAPRFDSPRWPCNRWHKCHCYKNKQAHRSLDRNRAVASTSPVETREQTCNKIYIK